MRTSAQWYAEAGLTRVIRKSVRTIIAKQNPRFARDQLGISNRVFEEHYNQPTIEDRLERGEILPGYGWYPSRTMRRRATFGSRFPSGVAETSAYG